MTRSVALSGKQGSGKTALAKALQEALEKRGEPTRVLSFAGPLKETALECLRALHAEGLLSDDMYWEDRFEDGSWKYHARPFLQTLGQSLRRHDPDVWVNLLLAKVDTLPEGTVVITDDCRYLNEARLLRERGFMLVRLEVSNSVRRARGVVLTGETHSSEVDLDNFGEWDQVFYFHGGDEDLEPEQVAQSILEHLDELTDEDPMGWV